MEQNTKRTWGTFILADKVTACQQAMVLNKDRNIRGECRSIRAAAKLAITEPSFTKLAFDLECHLSAQTLTPHHSRLKQQQASQFFS